MRLSLLYTSISAIFYIASAQQSNEQGGYSLVKREHGLPYATLPSNTCETPSACSNIATPVNCRCSDTLTTCQNSAGQFCWGSKSLNSTTCPTMPSSCTTIAFESRQATCLCNNANVLCVDNANNYCYGSISGSTVSIVPIPNAPPASASASASSAVPSAGASTNPSMSVIGAPSNSAPAATPTSASTQLHTTSLFTLGCALIAYIASQ